ncbi:MAG: PIN domain-containing protein [Chloroflexi bacterium]|nr:PIN domain-containing protein [Chloroflexota bacterium]
MRVLFDTNIVLDVLLKREPWVTDASALWQANDEGRIVGYVAASALTDIFYVARRLAELDTARAAIRVCLESFEICTVDRQTLEHANELVGNDFEDNLQIACATLADLDAIVTRDQPDFSVAAMPVYTPAELLARLSLTGTTKSAK